MLLLNGNGNTIQIALATENGMRGKISDRLLQILKSSSGRAELRILLQTGRDGLIRADGKVYRLRSAEMTVPVRVPTKG